MTSPADQSTFLQTLSAQVEQIDATIKTQLLELSATPPSTTPTSPSSDGFTGLNLGDPNVWNQTLVFADDFTGGNLNKWYQYPKGWQDTSKEGTYDPARASIVNNALRQQVTDNADGSFGGCTVCPVDANGNVIYLTNSRITERVYLVKQDNGHYVLLGWPANDSDWETKSGEPDDTESDTNNNPTWAGWLHVIGDSGDAHKVNLPSNIKMYDGYHEITVEQLVANSYRRYIDNVLTNVVLNYGVKPTAADKAAPHFMTLPSGLSVPGADALRVCKQLESNGNKPTAGGVIIDTDYFVLQTLKAA